MNFGDADQQRRKMASDAALDMATNMVTQAAHDHAQHLHSGHENQAQYGHGHEHGHSHGHSHGHEHAHSHDIAQNHEHSHSHSHSHAHGHQHPVDALPLCCVYSVKCAKRHLDRRNEHTGLGEDSPDLQPILSINKALLQRWTMSH